jgi:hypothetical protein
MRRMGFCGSASRQCTHGAMDVRRSMQIDLGIVAVSEHIAQATDDGSWKRVAGDESYASCRKHVHKPHVAKQKTKECMYRTRAPCTGDENSVRSYFQASAPPFGEAGAVDIHSREFGKSHQTVALRKQAPCTRTPWKPTRCCCPLWSSPPAVSRYQPRCMRS